MDKKDYIETLIIKSFSERITQEEIFVLKKWMSENPLNHIHYQELLNIWQISHPVFQPVDIDVTGAEKKVLDKIYENNFINSKVFIRWQRVAAILIIPIFMMMCYLFFQQSTRSSRIAMQEINSPYGMNSKVYLPDGSTVWLNSGSKLKYPVEFTETSRKVYLSGEAFFKVHSDKKHPFIVSTAKLDVKATGTQFNVEAYLTDTITAVTLMKGKVTVNMNDNQQAQLLPNERLVLNLISRTYSVTQTDDHWGMWKDGILAFRDETLGNVFKRIGRTYNVDIKVKDPAVARQKYRATFEGESLDEILRLLKISAPIKYKRVDRIKRSHSVYEKEQIEVSSN